MKPSEEFFSGQRYAIFGVKAKGRAQGPVLINALVKAGKEAIAIEQNPIQIKNATVHKTLAEAGTVDGVILLPPTPWDESAAEFVADAVRQCKEQGIDSIWIYTPDDPSAAESIAEREGFNPYSNQCPCLYISGGGFPHNLHQFLAKLFKMT